MSGPRRDPHAIKAMPADALVQEFRPLVGSIVNKLRRKLRIRVSKEDLEAYGYEGLLEAHDRFDPDTGAYFASYAYYRIRGKILDGCRKEGWLDRPRLARRARALDEMLETSAETERGAPRPRNVAEALERVTDIVDAAATIFLLSEADMETAAPVAPNQHRVAEQRTNRELLRQALQTLTDEEREVIKRHHLDEEPMDAIAENFEKSRSWVSRVNTRALRKLKACILSLE